ncbi:UNVERIFIED_CONTAM: hypothetical protein GTU68_013821 [Idotea baltica]|nr:hypothetical protein [Idotea baltica]
MFVALNKALALKRYAKSLGATEAEIDAFIESKAEQARIRKLATDYLVKNGVTPGGDSEAYCKLGEREMAQGTLIGSVLR